MGEDRRSRKPIMLAYGRWWPKDLWEKTQKACIPEFNGFDNIGIYVLYFDSPKKPKFPVYVGFAIDGKNPLQARLNDHAFRSKKWDKWNMFSWFIIDKALFVDDIENLCLLGFSPLTRGEIRSHRPTNRMLLGLNKTLGGNKLENTKETPCRNYWLDDEGNLLTVDEQARSLLTPKWQTLCDTKRRRERRAI